MNFWRYRWSSLIIAACLLVELCLAQDGFARVQRTQVGPRIWSQSQPIAVDVISSPGATPDSTRTDIYVAVPFSKLSFLYSEAAYVATYGLVVQVLTPESQHLLRDNYQACQVTQDPAVRRVQDDHGMVMADAEQISMQLLPGTYAFRIHVRDETSHNEYDTLIHATVRNFPKATAMLSDPLIYRDRQGGQILPIIGGDVSNANPHTGGVFSVLYGSTLPAGGWAVAIIQPTTAESLADGASGMQQAVKIAGASGPVPIFLPMDFTPLWIGKYNLSLFILPPTVDTAGLTKQHAQQLAIAEVSRSIEVRTMHGVPISEANLNEAISQLLVIASTSAADSLEAARTPFEKRKAIVQFWRGEDPTPEAPGNRAMEVFYDRVEAANHEFGNGSTKGWKTDRGTVYIQLGEPDYIDRHPYQANERPYEVWEYQKLGMKFYFVDPYMLGDYQLVGAGPPRGTFVWQ